MSFTFEKEFKIRNSRHSFSIVKVNKGSISCYITCGFMKNEGNKYELEIYGAPLSENDIIRIIDDLYWESGGGYNFDDGDIGTTVPGNISYCMKHVRPTDFVRDGRAQGYYDNEHEDLYRLRVIIADQNGFFPWDENCAPEYMNQADAKISSSERKYAVKVIYDGEEIHHYSTEGMAGVIGYEIELAPLYPKSESMRILNRICMNASVGALLSNNASVPEYRQKTAISDKSSDSSNITSSLRITYIVSNSLSRNGSQAFRAIITDERGRYPWDELCSERFKSQLSDYNSCK